MSTSALDNLLRHALQVQVLYENVIEFHHHTQQGKARKRSKATPHSRQDMELRYKEPAF
jgi:hypothetical protein